MEQMDSFLLGVMAMGYAVVGVFFLRFWRDTDDRLFASFAMSFFLLSVTRIGLALAGRDSEAMTVWYWLRLLAYALIVLAILDKNLPLAPRTESDRP